MSTADLCHCFIPGVGLWSSGKTKKIALQFLQHIHMCSCVFIPLLLFPLICSNTGLVDKSLSSVSMHKTRTIPISARWSFLFWTFVMEMAFMFVYLLKTSVIQLSLSHDQHKIHMIRHELVTFYFCPKFVIATLYLGLYPKPICIVTCHLLTLTSATKVWF